MFFPRNNNNAYILNSFDNEFPSRNCIFEEKQSLAEPTPMNHPVIETNTPQKESNDISKIQELEKQMLELRESIKEQRDQIESDVRTRRTFTQNIQAKFDDFKKDVNAQMQTIPHPKKNVTFATTAPFNIDNKLFVKLMLTIGVFISYAVANRNSKYSPISWFYLFTQFVNEVAKEEKTLEAFFQLDNICELLTLLSNAESKTLSDNPLQSSKDIMKGLAIEELKEVYIQWKEHTHGKETSSPYTIRIFDDYWSEYHKIAKA